MRVNGDAPKANHFYILEQDVGINGFEWSSANRISLGLANGLIVIWQIDEEDRTTNRVIKQIKHDVSIGISTILLKLY